MHDKKKDRSHQTAHERGVITLAIDREEFVRQAMFLSLSLKRFNTTLPIAIITKLTDHPLIQKHFDYILPYDPAYGSQPMIHKLCAYEYSPFKETLYIDSDSLVVGNLDDVWNLFSTLPSEVSSVGTQLTQGQWYGKTLDELKEVYGITYLPKFNGGFQYFRKGNIGQKVFQRAYELITNYENLELSAWREGYSDEPCWAIAMAEHQQHLAPDPKKIASYTPIGLHGPLIVDVLEGRASFKKYNEMVNPRIVHFAGRTSTFHYLRETKKLSWLTKRRPKQEIKAWLETPMNIIYATLIAFHRFIKRIKGQKTSYGTNLPVLNYKNFFFEKWLRI